jgi:hypothetical protein
LIGGFASVGKKRKRVVFIIGCLGLSALAWIAFRTVRGFTMFGYVDSALFRVRVVDAAETKFAKAHPEVGYTCTLSQLPDDYELMERLTKDGRENGYSFEIVGCQAADSKKPNSTYQVTARPLHSGLPAFCSDPSGVRSDDTGSVEKCLANGSPLFGR